MHDDRSHPILQQTPLSVNPFIDLPKAPTLPHNYASIPSTLPPSILHAAPTTANPDLPAYVTSSSGFASHPNSIIAQNNALLEQMEEQRRDAEKKVREWEQSIENRELAEKRRKAPGWLDSSHRILEPEKPKAEMPGKGSTNLMDDPVLNMPNNQMRSQQHQDIDDLGAAMDRAFA